MDCSPAIAATTKVFEQRKLSSLEKSYFKTFHKNYIAEVEFLGSIEKIGCMKLTSLKAEIRFVFKKKLPTEKSYCTHRVISDRVRRLLVTLSYFRPDRIVQLHILIPILILLLYLLVSIDLVYTGLWELVPE